MAAPLSELPPALPPHHLAATYGRRQGRALKPIYRRALAERLPALAAPWVPGERLNPASYFPSSCKAIHLELGFGAGDHLLHQLTARPEIGFLAAEIWRPGLARLARHIPSSCAEQVKLIPHAADLVLAALPPASLAAIYILFPDPWPKRGHAHRRFCSAAQLAEMARVVKLDGHLFFASDHPTMTAQLLAATSTADSGWRWQAADAATLTPRAWEVPWPAYAPTRYDLKARRQNRRPTYLRFTRR